MERSSHSVTVRMPTRTDYWQTAHLPRPGTTISYCGHTYLVVSCEERAAETGYVVELAEAEAVAHVTAPTPA